MSDTRADSGMVAAATFVACHSIVELSLRHPTAQRALLDPQFLHKLVMSGFYGWVKDGEPDPRAQLQVLHTSTVDLKADLLTVVVQARVQPDWSRVPRPALAAKPVVINIEHRVEVGQEYTFRTVVHPTRDTFQRPGQAPRVGEQRRRRTQDEPELVRAWFAERLQPHGEPAVSQPRGVRRIGVDGDAAAFEVTVLPETQDMRDRPGQRLTRAEIQGTVIVTDVAAFVDTLIHGFGRSRSLGCGLLLIKPTGRQEVVGLI